MLIAHQWLKSMVNTAWDEATLCDKLTMAGLEVEGVTPVAPPFTGVVVAHVVSCRDHENSDHLHVCEVDAGTGELIPIVCGAPNVRTGVKVPCALEGAVLPGGFTIKKTKLRGELSRGMLCSQRELGIGDDHGGLWILPEDAPIGMNIRKYANLDESVIEIKLTPNRGDALSILGVARDVMALDTEATLSLPDMTAVEPTCTFKKEVQVQAPDLCGRFTGRSILNIDATRPTPEWMKARLERSGMRSINILVDISNYVMLELGRPSHFFDLKKLSQDALVVRWGREGESVRLLNDMEINLNAQLGVIADGDNPCCLAGIMGGADSGVSTETTDIFMEVAFWHPSAIQGRTRQLNFGSDAAHRFERGVDFGTHLEHMERLTRLVLELCSTPETKIGPVDDQIIALPVRQPVSMRVERCNKIIGIDIDPKVMHEIFTRLGFNFTLKDGVFTVTPPTHRFDIEIEEDLIEEVARMYGYEHLPVRAPVATMSMRHQPETMRSNHQLRIRLAHQGYQELINFGFVPPEWEKHFGDPELEPIQLLNPIASHLSVMRTQLLGGLVDNLRYNLNRKANRVRVFELGRVFQPDPAVLEGPWSVNGIRQPLHVAGLAYGPNDDIQWGVPNRDVDFYDVKGDIESLLAPLQPRFERAVVPGLHPGRSANIYVGETRIGTMGELHPAVQQAFDLPKAPIVFELEVPSVLSIPMPQYKPLPKFQAISRDIAVIVPHATELATLMTAVQEARISDPRVKYLTDIALFDVYRRQGEDTKSLAFTLTLDTSDDEPLVDAQIEACVEGVVNAMERVGASWRK